MKELFFAILAVVLSSAICSCIEAAVLSVSLVKVKQLVSEKTASSSVKTLLKIKENINSPLTTIVILNNIANIGGSMIVGETAISMFGNKWMGIFSAILTFFIIIFGEIIPKTTGETHSLKISIFFAKPIYYLTTILLPLVWVIEKITRKFINKKVEFFTNESEIKTMATIGYKEGSIEEEESALIQKIFELNDVTAEQIMTPRVAVTCLNSDQTLAEIKNTILNSQHSRMLVINEDKDHIAGIVLKNELMKGIIEGKMKTKVSEFTHEANYVMEAHKVSHLLEHFKKTRKHIAVVVDEYGGMSGVVTFEDVLEELTGEIVDETDKVIDMQEFAKKCKKNKITKTLK